MVGLCRPGGVFCVGGGRRLARKRLWRPISIGVEAFGRWSACADREVSFASAEADAWRGGCRLNSAWGGLRPMVGLRRPGGGLLRWRRPTPGAQRLGRPISIGVEAFGRRLACADREGVFCVGVGRRLAWSALEGRFQSAWRPSADGWPVPTERCLLRRRRLTPGAQAPWKADFNRRGGLRPCVPNEFGLWGPSADGRPAPTGRGSFASAEADAWRAAPWKADFNRRGGLRPMVGLCRPKG
jgi:hypothetical protein